MCLLLQFLPGLKDEEDWAYCFFCDEGSRFRKYNGKTDFFNHHTDIVSKFNNKPSFGFQEKEKEAPIRVNDFTNLLATLFYPAII